MVTIIKSKKKGFFLKYLFCNDLKLCKTNMFENVSGLMFFMLNESLRILQYYDILKKSSTQCTNIEINYNLYLYVCV